MNYLYKKKDNYYICYNILYNDKPIDYYKIYSNLDTNKYELDLFSVKYRKKVIKPKKGKGSFKRKKIKLV